jgi:hypothetical protein
MMVVFGVGLIVFGGLEFPWSVTLLLFIINGFILFGLGYLIFQSAKRFRKIVETQGHDIMYLMEAMTDQKRLYTLIVALILISTLAMVASFMFVPGGS